MSRKTSNTGSKTASRNTVRTFNWSNQRWKRRTTAVLESN